MKSKNFPSSYSCNHCSVSLQAGVEAASFTGIALVAKEENPVRFHWAALKKCAAFLLCCNNFYNPAMLQPPAIITALLRMVYQSISSFLTHLRFITHHHLRSGYEHRRSCIGDGSGCAETD